MRRRVLWTALCLLILLNGSTALLGQPPRPAAPPPTAEEQLLSAMHGISSHTLLNYVAEMASEKYQGRLTGTAGYNASADWAIGLLKGWGLKPAGDNGTYLQHFANPYTLVLPGSELSLQIPIAGGATITKMYTLEQDYFPGSTSDSGKVTAEVVYVGYGVTAPELDVDEYQGVDVKGKIVLVEPEAPVSPDQDAEAFKKWRPYSFHDYKVKNAAQHGAAGMVYAYHIANPNCVFVKGLVLTYVGSAFVDDLFAGTGQKHTDVVGRIRTTRKPASMALGKTVTIKNVTEHHPEGIGTNVVAWLEGTDPVLKEQAIVIGAHLDHLGLNPELMPGAHDNASGVAVGLGAVQAIVRSKVPLKRSLVVVFFGAEEQGVKGSEYYVAHPFIANEKTAAMINLESVGRGERIGVGSGKNYPQIWEVFERLNTKYVHRPISASLNANLARPRQDAAHFLWANVPTVSLGTSGAPPLPYLSYHTSKDRVEIITPEIMEDLARLTFLSTVELANK